MSRVVTVADYNVGNLLSISRAIERVGARAKLTSDPDEVAGAEVLLLPGVGAFGHCASNLRAAGLVEPVLSFASTGKPFLGICVGMQLLFERSFEFGVHDGLGLIPGTVESIPSETDGTHRKIPHIGWSTLQLPQARPDWQGGPLRDLSPGQSSAYFVHSYSGRPAHPADWLVEVDYGGFPVCAGVQKDNLVGLQFHPEKSGPTGLKILQSFVLQR